MLKKIRKIDYRYYIYFALFSASILLAVFVYPTSYIRLWDSFVNLCTSVVFYGADEFDYKGYRHYRHHRFDVAAEFFLLLHLSLFIWLTVCLREWCRLFR